MDAERFGTFIQQRRKELGLKQADVAEILHVTDKAVSRWERGIGFPDIKLLEPLAEALELSVTELLQCRLMGENMPDAEIRDMQEETAVILETERKLSWQRKLILWLGYGIILTAAFVLVYISHQEALPAGLRFMVYAISLIGTFFTTHALQFIVGRMYLRSKPWGIWENPRTWLGWCLKIVGLLLAAYCRRQEYSNTNSVLMFVGIVMLGIGCLIRDKQKEE